MREAIATISESLPCCIAGMTFSVRDLGDADDAPFDLAHSLPLLLRYAARPAGGEKLTPLPSVPACGRRPAAPASSPDIRGLSALTSSSLAISSDVSAARRGEIVVELLDRLGADDDAGHVLLLQQPRERDPRDGTRRAPRRSAHRVDDVVGLLLIDRRKVERDAARLRLARRCACICRRASRPRAGSRP